MIEEYSEAELTLIEAVAPHWHSVIKEIVVNPLTLYMMMAEYAFIHDKRGPEIEALRRCCHAINDCKIFRKTKEWDELCQFEKKSENS